MQFPERSFSVFSKFNRRMPSQILRGHTLVLSWAPVAFTVSYFKDQGVCAVRHKSRSKRLEAKWKPQKNDDGEKSHTRQLDSVAHSALVRNKKVKGAIPLRLLRQCGIGMKVWQRKKNLNPSSIVSLYRDDTRNNAEQRTVSASLDSVVVF